MTVHDPKVLKNRLEQLAEELPCEVTSRPMIGGFIGYADGRKFVSIEDQKNSEHHTSSHRQREESLSRTREGTGSSDRTCDHFVRRGSRR